MKNLRKRFQIKKVKRILSALLVISVLSLTTMPKVAFAEYTMEEKEGNDKSAAIALSLLALVGLFWLISSSNSSANLEEADKYADNKPDVLPQSSEHRNASLSVRLDIDDMAYNQNIGDESFIESEKETRSPMVKLSYTW